MAARKPSTVHHYSGTGVTGDGFGYVEGGIFAALATASPCRHDRTCRRCVRDLRDDARDRRLQTRRQVRFLEPVGD